MLLLAPFKGITGKVYRNAFARHFQGLDEMYAPFISGVGTGRINPSKLTDVVPPEENLLPTVPQFISTDAREIILLGKTLGDYGYDHINWNLGCPFSRIANKKRGCGLLPYPDEIRRILDQVFPGFPIRLSIKTRLGYQRPDEIFAVLEVLNQYPIHLLILHPRIGTQVYSGDASPEGFAAAMDACRLPMAWNGDLYHAGRYHQLQQRFPQVQSWMPGRGILINPFMAMEIKGIPVDEKRKRELLRGFCLELLQEAGRTTPNEARLLGYMKAVWYYMSGCLSGSREVFAAIRRAHSISEYLQAVDQALQQPFANHAEAEEYFKKGIKHLGSEN